MDEWDEQRFFSLSFYETYDSRYDYSDYIGAFDYIVRWRLNEEFYFYYCNIFGISYDYPAELVIEYDNNAVPFFGAELCAEFFGMDQITDFTYFNTRLYNDLWGMVPALELEFEVPSLNYKIVFPLWINYAEREIVE